MREMIEGTMLLLPIPHMCLKMAPCSSYRESLELYFHILVGIFIIELGLYITMMGFLKCPRSSWASKLDAHPLVFLLSFYILIALVHLLYGNPYSFTLISINGHIHSLLIHRVNVTISSFLSHNHHNTLFHL